MKKLFASLLFATLALPATARDDRLSLSIAEALATPAAESKIDKSIPLYFGDQKHPATSKKLGEWSTNKKTNALNKSDKEACDWTFLSAVLELQERARKEGGNAVINIKSNYKNQLTSSDTEYRCGVGAVVSGVALKGTVVQLRK
jgi:uncharacterized protein YbjQ (UPF0145 family)